MSDGHASGWLLDARFYRALLVAWLALVLLYGLWRSRGDARPDEIRPSGPIE